MKRLAVYCGSATPADLTYVDAARHVGRTLAQRGIGVVYGGGRLGLMGALAQQRKQLFTDLSDGFVTLPGGVGTMDELWEAISWAQLGYHEKPVGLLNVAGFYDQLIGFNRQMVETGFIRPQHAGILVYEDRIEALIDAMAAYQPHETIFAMRAERL